MYTLHKLYFFFSLKKFRALKSITLNSEKNLKTPLFRIKYYEYKDPFFDLFFIGLVLRVLPKKKNMTYILIKEYVNSLF